MAEREASVDEWVQEFDEAMALAEEIMARIHQERSSSNMNSGSGGGQSNSGDDSAMGSDSTTHVQQVTSGGIAKPAVRKLTHQVSMTSTSRRRKLSQLAHKLEHLESRLQDPDLRETISEKEMYRRQDMLLGIRFRTKKMAYTMGSFKSHSRKNLLLATQSAAGTSTTAAIPTTVVIKTNMEDLNSSTAHQGSSDIDAGAKLDLVAGLVSSSEKVLGTNQLQIGSNEPMSLNHIAIKVTDEQELNAPLLVNFVHDTCFKNISVQDKKHVIVATKSNWCCILMWICILVFATVATVISLFVLRSPSKHP